MSSTDLPIAYVVKRFPRYSETFIVTELLAHEAAGWTPEIFALRPPSDTHFQADVARLRAPVHYLPHEGLRAADLWAACRQTSAAIPDLWTKLEYARAEDARDVFQAVLLAGEVRRRRIAHLHAHFGSLPTTVARLAARFAGVPYSFTAHAKDIFVDGVGTGDLARKLLDAAFAVTVSEFNLEYLKSQYGAAARRVRRIYNGLDLSRFGFRGYTNRRPIVVSVGRLVEKKGFQHLIDACAHLAEAGRGVECRIIGTGEQEAELRERIAERGVSGSVHLLGPRPSDDVRLAVAEAAVFAAPCIVGRDGNRDGLPTTVLEAMALGTPVVTTDVTGLPEAVRHERTGLVVPPADAVALATAIARLLDDAALAARLARGARQLIEQRFDTAANAAELRDAWVAAATRPAEIAS